MPMGFQSEEAKYIEELGKTANIVLYQALCVIFESLPNFGFELEQRKMFTLG